MGEEQKRKTEDEKGEEERYKSANISTTDVVYETKQFKIRCNETTSAVTETPNTRMRYTFMVRLSHNM